MQNTENGCRLLRLQTQNEKDEIIFFDDIEEVQQSGRQSNVLNISGPTQKWKFFGGKLSKEELQDCAKLLDSLLQQEALVRSLSAF